MRARGRSSGRDAAAAVFRPRVWREWASGATLRCQRTRRAASPALGARARAHGCCCFGAWRRTPVLTRAPALFAAPSPRERDRHVRRGARRERRLLRLRRRRRDLSGGAEGGAAGVAVLPRQPLLRPAAGATQGRIWTATTSVRRNKRAARHRAPAAHSRCARRPLLGNGGRGRLRRDACYAHTRQTHTRMLVLGGSEPHLCCAHAECAQKLRRSGADSLAASKRVPPNA